MTVRFQADADFNQIILLSTIRREPTIDFQTAVAAGLQGLSDEQVLALAAREGRILVTHDQKTMPRHFANLITSQTSPGVLIVPQHVPYATVVDDFVLIWLASEAEEWVNRICFLPL